MVEQLKKRLSNPDSLVSLFLGIAVVIVVGILIFNFFKERRGTPETAAKDRATEQQATGSADVATYTVKQGETLWSIAESTIGSGYNWVDIADANKLSQPGQIEAGQKLNIPKVAKRSPGQVATSSIEIKRPADNKYTVKTGDSLWKISLEIYGTGYRWSDIATLNKLSNPNLIFNGNVLLLP